jgi:hypothetical protein
MFAPIQIDFNRLIKEKCHEKNILTPCNGF